MKKTNSYYATFREVILMDSNGLYYKAYMKNNRVMLAKSMKDGRFVKLSIVQSIYDFWERLKCIFVVLACILANIFAIHFIATN